MFIPNAPRMLFDAELAWKVYDHIIAHPEEWYQGTWVNPHYADETYTKMRCGTKACYAGTIALMTAPEGTKFYGDAMLIPDPTGEPEFPAFLAKSYLNYAVEALSKGTTTSDHTKTEELTAQQRNLRCSIEHMFSARNSLGILQACITDLAAKYPSV